jgi:hypothetical protein
MIMQTKRPFVVLPCKSKTVRADQIGRVAILRNLLAASGIDIPTGNSPGKCAYYISAWSWMRNSPPMAIIDVKETEIALAVELVYGYIERHPGGVLAVWTTSRSDVAAHKAVCPIRINLGQAGLALEGVYRAAVGVGDRASGPGRITAIPIWVDVRSH